MVYLLLCVVGVMVLPLLSSCGKENGVSSSNNNARFIIANLSPDVQPIKLYTRFTPQSSAVYSYPSISSYSLINVADTPLQIRNVQSATNLNPTNLLTLNRSLVRGVPFTLFIMGLKVDSSLTYVLTADTTSEPANGRGKIRFVNGIFNIPSGLNLTLNDTAAFKQIPFKGTTKFVEVTAGSYNINIVASNNPTQAIRTLTNFTILDGKSYTIFSYGRSSSTSDTASYGINTILNTLPVNTTY